jgi:gamma-glutamylcyclotransferase (GGCT)/AIG2-like uncharacterized protein YtfP
MSADPSQLPAWQSADGRHFYVFVYGTLRRGEINDIVLAAKRHGIAEPAHIGTARIPGRLFDYGDWPGILPGHRDMPPGDVEGAGSAAPTVLGDVFYAPMPLLAVLDDIEGIQEHERGAFYRMPCTLRLLSGETRHCVYYPVDEASTVSCPLIEGGDWIAYRKVLRPAKALTSPNQD